MMIRILATMIVYIGLASSVVAQEFKKGLDAYNSADYATALKEWKPLAEQGLALVQNELGNMYVEGRGVTQDYTRALEFR